MTMLPNKTKPTADGADPSVPPLVRFAARVGGGSAFFVATGAHIRLLWQSEFTY